MLLEKHFITENGEVAVNQEVEKLRGGEAKLPKFPNFSPSVVNYYGKAKK